MSRETVEKYKLGKDKQSLIWVKTFADDKIFRNINDLNVIGDDEFYSKLTQYNRDQQFEFPTTSIQNKTTLG